MLRNIVKLTQSRLLVPSLARGHATKDTDVPTPNRTPTSPPGGPQEVPKIDRSRPLPPPAYAGSRLGNVQGAEDIQDHPFKQPDIEYTTIDEPPKSPEDIRAMDHEFNVAHKNKDTRRPEIEFDERFDSDQLHQAEARQDTVTRRAKADRDQVHQEIQSTTERDLAKMRAMGLLDQDQPERDIDNQRHRK